MYVICAFYIDTKDQSPIASLLGKYSIPRYIYIVEHKKLKFTNYHHKTVCYFFDDI